MESKNRSDTGKAASHESQAVQGLRWVGAARLLSQVVTWGLTAVTVRLLQPRDYGLVATSGLFTIFASMVMDGGLSPMLVSHRGLSRTVHGAATVGVFLLSSVFAAAIVLVAPLSAEFFNDPALAPVLRVASLQLPLSALAVVPLALLSRQMSFRRIAIIQTVTSIVQGLATLALAYEGEAYWALIYATLLGSSIRTCGLWLALEDRPPLNWRLQELGPILKNCVHMVGQRVLYFVSADFDTFILSRLTGAAELGPYSLARTLSHAALDQISGVVNQVTLPSFAAKSGDPVAQVAALKVMLAVAATTVFPLFWLLGVTAPTAFPLMFGPRWIPLVFPFTAFTLMLPLRAVYALVDNAVIGTGNTATTFRNMFVWAAIMIPVLLCGAMFGAKGEAVAWVVGFPLVFISAMRRISSRFEVKLTEMLRPMLAPAACAAGAAGMAEIFAFSMGASFAPLATLALQIAVAVGSYWLLMFRFGTVHYHQVTRLAWRLLGR